MSEKSLWSFTSTHSHKLGCSLVVVNATRVGEKLGFSYVRDNVQFVPKPNSVKIGVRSPPIDKRCNSLIMSCTENVQLEITKRDGGGSELYGKRTRMALLTA